MLFIWSEPDLAIEWGPIMITGKNSIQESHYRILSVKEDASYEEIRTSYRSAIFNSHPDKLQKTSEIDVSDHESTDRFMKVKKAWEILSDFRSRSVYDCELRASRQDMVAAEDVSLEDMMVENTEEALELFYQCRCGDYFSVDSSDLGKMGFTVLKDADKILILTPNASPSSVVLPCGSCSLRIRLWINVDSRISVDDHL
ncbi:DnaJ domain-containing protein/zf-CSL domain-containing protein [Cephalotus follicularis]|uniref:DnaJ domain-containing protein/zf-CSL domain-containing protein n=1 Tax=Cephalotus follicularis TaxID=3775 RepID=A0A1Q3AQ65_CEPFO|nr:DnaJ domain-containing protein/zf-CSL domain-containing protein [Cephalotus follicularis]